MTDRKAYANKLIDQLVQLDHQTTAAYYDMGQLLYTIREADLYKDVGYNSITELVEEELSFTPSTAVAYTRLFSEFKRLKYTKNEALKLLKKFGYTHMCKVLPKENQKIGERAVKNRIDELEDHQINFTLNNAELEEAHKALERMGAMITSTGRWVNSSEAFMEIVRLVNKNGGLKKAA